MTRRARAGCCLATAFVALTTLTVATPATADTVTRSQARQIRGRDVLADPEGIALDAHGNIYVANSSMIVGNSVAVYPPSATGFAAPDRVISGDHTELDAPDDVAVDSAGNVYTTNLDDAIRVFAPDADGDVAPIRTITGPLTFLSYPSGVSVGSNGDIYVADNLDNFILVFGPAASGNVSPIRVIRGPDTELARPLDLVADKTGLYVTSGRKILEFPLTASGNVAPIRVIAPTGTKEQVRAWPDLYSVAVDDLGNVYATTFDKPRVEVFDPASDTRPLRIMRPRARVEDMTGIAVYPDRSLAVSNLAAGTLRFYPPLMPGTPVAAPGAVTRLRVRQTGNPRVRVVRWDPPAANGGRPLAKFRVVVMKGTHRLTAVRLPGSVRKLRLHREQLGKARVKVLVSARNKFAYGPARKATVRFGPAAAG